MRWGGVEFCAETSPQGLQLVFLPLSRIVSVGRVRQGERGGGSVASLSSTHPAVGRRLELRMKNEAKQNVLTLPPRIQLDLWLRLRRLLRLDWLLPFWLVNRPPTTKIFHAGTCPEH